MTFLKTNIITIASKIICLAASLFISIYIARFLGPSAKGAYYLLIQTVSILATMSLFGSDAAAIYYLGKRYSSRSVVIVSNFLIIALGIVLTLALLLAHKTYFLGNVLITGGFGQLAIIAFAIPFMGVARLNSAILMGFNRFISFNILNIALYVVMAINFIIFVIILRMGLFGALLSFMLAYLILSIVYMISILKSQRLRVEYKEPLENISAAILLSYGWRAFLVPILLLVLYRVDSFFLNYYATIGAVGFYSVALSFAELLLFIPESTGTILLPKLVYSEPGDIDNRFIYILRISIALTFATAVLFLLTIRYVLPFVYGDVYLPSVQLTYILLPGLVAMSTYYLFSSYFQAIGRPGLVTGILVIALTVKIVFCNIFIPKISSSGAAIASTISYLVCFMVFLTVFVIRSKFKLSEVFILKSSDVNFIKNSLNDIFDFQK